MRPPDTSHTDKYQKDNQFLHPRWCTVAEDCWCSVAEDNWRTVGEDHWCIMPEDRWCIVARGVTWVTEIRGQRLRAGVPFFFKQWGGTNKKKAGHVLEGRTWDQMPGELLVAQA
jgi:protein gp37